MNSVQSEPPDNLKREQLQKRMRQAQIGMAFFGICIGLTSFARVAGKPRFEGYHTLDVIGLMTAGAGFAAALVGLIQFFAFRDSRSESKKE